MSDILSNDDVIGSASSTKWTSCIGHDFLRGGDCIRSTTPVVGVEECCSGPVMSPGSRSRKPKDSAAGIPFDELKQRIIAEILTMTFIN